MFKEVILKTAKMLGSNKIPYMIIGGQALLIYKEIRMTRDIDITLGIDIDMKNSIIELLKKNNIKILPENPIKFIDDTMTLPCMDIESKIRIYFIFSYSEFERDSIKNSKIIKIDDYEIKYASLETLIIMKMIAGRDRDLEDIRKLIILNNDINYEYIYNTLYKIDNELDSDYAEQWEKIYSTKYKNV